MDRNSKIMISFLVFTLAIFIYSLNKGKDQIQARKDSYLEFIEAVENIDEGNDLEESINSLERVELQFGENENILLSKVTGYIKLSEYEKVENILDEAIKENQDIEENAELMLMYSKSLIENNNLEKAKEILDKISTLELDSLQMIIFNELNNNIG
jgi:tetratricopeptide (TPR) repeat protein